MGYILWLVFLLQYPSTAIFTFINESSRGFITDLALMVMIVSYISYVILYFINKQKLVEKVKFTSLKFNIILFITWNISALIIFAINCYLGDGINVLKGDGGFLGGIEYLIIPLLLILTSITIVILKFIIYIYSNFLSNIIEGE